MKSTAITLGSLFLAAATSTVFASAIIEGRQDIAPLHAADAAAYSGRGLGEFVQNGTFDSGREPWSAGTSGLSTWTGAENLFGPMGSGSLFVRSVDGFEAVGSAQCIGLPEAARFLLTGAGRNAVATNTLAMRWELRFDGSPSCTSGPADRSGSLVVASSTAWTMPQPVSIDIFEGEWTADSSITITLIASGRAPGGFFDGITMDIEHFEDVIFANDFELESTAVLPDLGPGR